MTGLVLDLHSRAAVREAGVGGTDRGGAPLGLTAPAGTDACSCVPFFQDCAHAFCPIHGLDALVRGFMGAA